MSRIIYLFKVVMSNLKNIVEPKKFGELLLTRFTHDIAGPISAVSNGIDFLMENKDADDAASIDIKNQAVDIIEDSAKQSLARLQAYRMAYGIVYKADAITQIPEVTEIFKKYFHKSLIEIRWNSTTPKEIPANQRQALVCLILVLSKILIYGGKISVSFAGDNKNEVIVRGTNERIKDPAIVKGILENNTELQPDVENVIYFFTREVCSFNNANLTFSLEEKDDAKHIELKVVF